LEFHHELLFLLLYSTWKIVDSNRTKANYTGEPVLAGISSSELEDFVAATDADSN